MSNLNDFSISTDYTSTLDDSIKSVTITLSGSITASARISATADINLKYSASRYLTSFSIGDKYYAGAAAMFVENNLLNGTAFTVSGNTMTFEYAIINLGVSTAVVNRSATIEFVDVLSPFDVY